jgi:hypothetical protein
MRTLVINDKANLLYVLILSAQCVFVLFAYVINPGRTNVTLTAFQPDSLNSICLAEIFAPDKASFNLKVQELIDFFEVKEGSFTCYSEFVVTYKTRIFLPIIISLFGTIGTWPFMLFPSILIYFLIGFTYWRLVREFAIKSNKNFIFSICPFLSPHISGHLVNLMSEGPALLFLLILIAVLPRALMEWSLKSTAAPTVAVFSGLLSRQIWPIISIILSETAYSTFIKLRKYHRLLIASLFFLLPFVFSVLIDRLLNPVISTYGREEWNIGLMLSNVDCAFLGLKLGLIDDFKHVMQFVDLPFVIFSILLFMFWKKTSLQGRIVLFVSLAWGLTTISFVYLADGSYGQNFRFLVFFFVLFPVVAARYPRKQLRGIDTN